MSPRTSPLRRAFTKLLVASAFVSLAACSHTKVADEWSAPALKEEQYGKVLVVTVLPAFNRRQTAEDRIVAALNERGATAVRSWDVLAHEDLANREKIQEAIRSKGADSLLAVKVMSRDSEREVNQGREKWVPSGTGLDYYGYMYTSYELARSPEITELRTLTLETTLWDVASRSIVWACRSESSTMKDTITTAEVADDYAATVAKKVRPFLRSK